MTHKREIFDDWIATWVHVRGYELGELAGWPLIPVGSATRQTELVCLDPGVDRFADLAAHIAGDPSAMLTVLATDISPYRLAPLAPKTRIDRDDEVLMTAELSPPVVPHLGDEFTFRWDIEDHRLTYTVESGDSVAAVGTVGVLGEVATFDAVETTPLFQRRGLGRHVMTTLSQQAFGRGARRGVLAASDQGRQLYQSLGWTTELQMLSLMGESHPG